MKLTRLISCLSLASLLVPAAAQTDATQLYGTVTTVEGTRYTGPIRWGKEEASWFDLFNANKDQNPYSRYLTEPGSTSTAPPAPGTPPTPTTPPTPPQGQEDGWNWNWSWNWGGKRVYAYGPGHAVTHLFAVPFGAIAKVVVMGREEAEVILRDGKRYTFDGGSNDLGATLQVVDPEIGTLSLEWTRVRSIEFADSPARTEKRFGSVLYGTVETYAGSFTGFIQWDHDERLDTDKLDGDTRDGDVAIDFGNIKTIARDGLGVNVVLNSGRELRLTGSNDVNSDNRGIIVYSPENGGVDIPWREFRTVTFASAAPNRPTFADYKSVGALTGTVKTLGGTTYTGRLVYDLDEEAGYELIQGKEKGLDFELPLFLIKRILPKGSYGATVILKSGTSLFLEGTQDVSDDHDGVLIFKNSTDTQPQYVRWNDIEEIVFD